jgi:8-oxo-dGTP diphosphatase
MSDGPLWERDPAAWAAHLADGNATQARKRVSADAIIRDQRGHVLVVRPTYKPGWDLPGGMVEANEPPDRAVQRELREELGLDLAVGRLLCVDWVPPHGPWDDLIAFVVDGGVLTASQIRTLHPTDDEIADFTFCRPAELTNRLSSRLARRIAVAHDALVHDGGAAYLVDGRLVSASHHRGGFRGA